MWRLVELGSINGYMMTNLYEAVGRAVSNGAVPNTVILNHPVKPFVNIGFHQIMEKEINVDFARKMKYDLVRRTIGGGAILDGPWEQDYFIIVNRNSPICPATIPEFYSAFLRPPVYALRKLGLDANIRPPNDILVDGRKISGNGAISIEKANVLAGDLLLDVPTDLMSKIIRAPSEKFKDKVAESMAEWLTSIRSVVGKEVSRNMVKEALVEGFEKELHIDFKAGELTEWEKRNLNGLIQERVQEKWIFGKDLEHRKLVSDARAMKVRGGVVVSEAVHKAGKMIRTTVVSKDNRIQGVSISGDFFTVPYQSAITRLEEALVGVPLSEDALRKIVDQAYVEQEMRVFGAEKEDFVKAIMKTVVDTS